MTAETPPDDWVLLEAAERFTWLTSDIETLRLIYTSPKDPEDHGFRALCDMIAKHEKPPVDRKMACAEKAMREIQNSAARNAKGIQLFTAKDVAIRAIELWEEGFGK
jgi:hypothetical protein